MFVIVSMMPIELIQSICFTELIQLQFIMLLWLGKGKVSLIRADEACCGISFLLHFFFPLVFLLRLPLPKVESKPLRRSQLVLRYVGSN